MKKQIIAVAVFASFLFIGAGAQAITMKEIANKTEKLRRSIKTELKTVKKECKGKDMKEARMARRDAIRQAFKTYKDKVSAAKEEYRTTIKSHSKDGAEALKAVRIKAKGILDEAVKAARAEYTKALTNTCTLPTSNPDPIVSPSSGTAN